MRRPCAHPLPPPPARRTPRAQKPGMRPAGDVPSAHLRSPCQVHLARSPGAGASLAPRAVPASCTPTSPAGAPLTRGAAPRSPPREDDKNPPPLRRAPSNFRNCSQLAGTRETRRLRGERAPPSAAGGPALPGAARLQPPRRGRARGGAPARARGGDGGGGCAGPRRPGTAPPRTPGTPESALGAPGARAPRRGTRGCPGVAAPGARALLPARPPPALALALGPVARGRGARGRRSPHRPPRRGE